MSEVVSFRFDDKELQAFVTSMAKDKKKIRKRAIAAAINPIKKMARASVEGQMKSAKLVEAVRAVTWKNTDGGTVYVRGPQDYHAKKGTPGYSFYKLLFFETGTAMRYVRKRNSKMLSKRARRGVIGAKWFMRNAIKAEGVKIGERIERVIQRALMKNERR